VTEAERLLQHAIEIAHRQHARSLELRAALDLSRCWQQQGKGRQARNMLAKVYQWFQEGFETPDLQKARALLATLA
jgi:predicted ATPase